MAKDRELADHERAHSGKAGMKPRHGQDALGRVKMRQELGFNSSEIKQIKDWADKYGPPKED